MIDFKHVHFVGIGGIGMSGLARVLLSMGVAVSGSDLKSSAITERLKEMGAHIFVGHNAANLPAEAEAAVISSAVKEDNPEVAEAKKRNLPIILRGSLLSLIMNKLKGIAVAGTHGKTTTSAMVSHVLEKAALDPTFIVGGVLKEFGTNAKFGKGIYGAAEADESDASFVELSPFAAVVTSIDADVNLSSGAFDDCHNDYQEVIGKIKKLFVKFINGVQEGGFAVLCGDHPGVVSVLPEVKSRIITYGIGADNQFSAADIEFNNYTSSFSVLCGGKTVGRVSLPMPGIHNVQNALACIAVCMEIGITFEEAASALASFKGVRRRFDVVSREGGITIVDDYAHNPEKVEAALKGAKSGGSGRLIAVFQPHRYSRTSFLLNQFPKVFSKADVLIVADIYSAGEEPIEGVSSKILADKILKEKNRPEEVVYIDNFDGIVKFVKNRSQSGDLVMFLGAGDICRCAVMCADSISGKA